MTPEALDVLSDDCPDCGGALACCGLALRERVKRLEGAMEKIHRHTEYLAQGNYERQIEDVHVFSGDALAGKGGGC